jgi:hypothetical protein
MIRTAQRPDRNTLIGTDPQRPPAPLPLHGRNLTHDNVLYHDRGALVRSTEISLFCFYVASAGHAQSQQV